MHKYVSDSRDFSVIRARSPAFFRDTLRTYITSVFNINVCVYVYLQALGGSLLWHYSQLRAVPRGL